MRFSIRFSVSMIVAFAQASYANELTVSIVPAISDSYVLENYVPAEIDSLPVIELVAAPDEHEPASFVITAHEDLNDLLVGFSEITDAEGRPLVGASLDIRIVKRWFQRIFASMSDPVNPRLRRLTPELLVYDDKLIKTEGTDNYLRLIDGSYTHISAPGRVRQELTPTADEFPVEDADELQPLTLKNGENRQLWLTLFVPPGAAPGIYSATVTVSQSDKRLVNIPVEIEVLPFELAEPVIDYSIYYRGKLDRKWPEGTVSSEYKSRAQMLSDFKNMAAHRILNPAVYQYFSTGLLDDVLELRRQAGLDNSKLFYLGVPQASVKSDAPVSPQLAPTIRTVLKAAADFGVEDIYFYSRDEAKGDELRSQFSHWDAIKAAGGKVMAAGWQTSNQSKGNFDISNGEEDLFVSLGALRYQEARRWHSKAKLIYSYQNPTGGWEIPETWRRNYGLLLWQNEYDGAMPYAWQHAYGNVWNDFDSYLHKDHNFTYPTVSGQIDTTQWEGLREAADDVRYLSTLMAAIESAEAVESPALTEAKAWLVELKTRPLGQDDLDQIRAEMVAHIMALTGTEPASPDEATVSDVVVLPIEPDGNVAVSWKTAGRAPGYLELTGSDKKLRAGSAGLSRDHVLRVSGLKQNSRYSFSVYSALDESKTPLQYDGFIDSSTDIKLSANTLRLQEGLQLDADLSSNYRASIGVDWQDSLIGWWRFSDPEKLGFNEASPGEPAKLKGGASVTDGWFGSGLLLDGEGAFINMPDVEIEENGAGTIEGWFRFNSFAMDNLVNRGIFTGLYQHSATNNFYISGTNRYFLVGSMLTLDTWHHIALTWDGDEATALLYIDGKQVPLVIGRDKIGAMAEVSGLNIGRKYEYLGGLVGPATDTFDGKVDEVRVWRRALSHAEIMASYDAHQSGLRFVLPSAGAAVPKLRLIGANAADQIVK